MADFRLQPVLNYRQILEDQARQSLAEAMEAESALLAKLTREREAEAALHLEFEERQRDGIAPDELALYRSYISRRVKALAELVEEWEAAHAEIEIKREALLVASQEKKVLEKLKEKKEEEKERKLRLEEANFMDEIAVQNFKR